MHIPLHAAVTADEPLRRLVQSAIGDKLARALLSGEIRDGDDVVVDWPADVADGDAGLKVTRG